MTTEKLTELENKVLTALEEGDEFEEMPSMCIQEIYDETKLNKKILRGVLSSLFKKDLITEGEYPNGMTAYHLIIS